MTWRGLVEAAGIPAALVENLDRWLDGNPCYLLCL